MDKWTALEPVKLYEAASSTAASGARIISRAFKQQVPRATFIGPLPPDLHLLIIQYLPLYDLPAVARASRAFSKLVKDERLWEQKWKVLNIERFELQEVLAELQADEVKKTDAPKQLVVEDEDDLALFSIGGDDDFGEFTTAPPSQTSQTTSTGETFGQFVTSFNSLAVENKSSVPYITAFPSQHTFRNRFMKAHGPLSGLLPKLVSPAELALSHLFPSSSTLRRKGQILHLLALYLSPFIEPTRIWSSQREKLLAAIAKFDADLQGVFESAEERRDENQMKEASQASWEVWNGIGEWELGKVWMDKRDVFFESDRWDPLRNIRIDDTLDFDPMVVFMTHTLESLRTEGAVAIRIFPPAANVVLGLSHRIATEVIAEYIIPLLDRTRALSNYLYLAATPTTFSQAWRMVDVVVDIGNMGSTDHARKSSVGSQSRSGLHSRKNSLAIEQSPEGLISRTQAEDVIFRMFEQFMEEYLVDELETTRKALDAACAEWERKIATHADLASPNAPNFLASKNPAQVKRNVLASFTDVLLLPVQVVATGGTVAVKGLAKLNPQEWGSRSRVETNGYHTPLADDKDENGLFDLTFDDDHEPEVPVRPSASRLSTISLPSKGATLAPPTNTPGSRAGTPALRSGATLASRAPTPAPLSFDRLELFLSLDVALELIHAARDPLARVQTFQAYPGTYGYRVRDTLEQLFVLLLQAMGDRHICPGFEKAIDKMKLYKPDEHETTASVAPLLQFFELVHIADTIQSMVQVFFDRELASHIDRTDFMNAVIREKKRFENSLDDAVAAGLNAGTEVLMNQVEHIIWSRTGAREYYPAEGSTMDLGPTQGCREAIACLEMHCKLLKGSTSKEVLEVFYQEVGLRLSGIIQKHLKRQIISLEGGFQVIADLNAYYAFVSSLRVQQITQDFSNLKMLGHVYIVSDAKDLAQIVRDVTRYGGSFRPEDVYEFIQRRADWKKIEKTVDKTMYNLSFKEDCIIA